MAIQIDPGANRFVPQTVNRAAQVVPRPDNEEDGPDAPPPPDAFDGSSQAQSDHGAGVPSAGNETPDNSHLWGLKPLSPASPAGVSANTDVAALPVPAHVERDGVDIETNGASPAALVEAERICDLELRRPDLRATFQSQRVALVIIPANKGMTQLPEFSDLAGRQTFDGRNWDTVRGSGGMRIGDGRFVIGVSEESLAHLPSDFYGRGYSVSMHELGHTVQNKGVSDAERMAILNEYQARQANKGPWTDAYASSNEHEYFAQATNTYFGMNGLGNNHNGAAWLAQNDPPLYQTLEQIYGPPPT